MQNDDLQEFAGLFEVDSELGDRPSKLGRRSRNQREGAPVEFWGHGIKKAAASLGANIPDQVAK